MPAQRQIRIKLDEGILMGDLTVPGNVCATVLFAHGSGSSRLSSRNRFVAQRLNEHRLATLLIDLLTPVEEEEERFSAHLRFDIGLLTDRLSAATEWLTLDPDLRALPVGYFGASTGAAAALAASVRWPQHVKAVVSRGGRPDLALPVLDRVAAPTLLIVGDLDEAVMPLNVQAYKEIRATQKDLAVVIGATHLFGEPGKLEEVADLASAWFVRHLCP